MSFLFVWSQNLCAQKRSAYILETAPSLEKEKKPRSYKISFSASSRAATLSFPFRGPHAFNVRTEYFRSSSLPKTFAKFHGLSADWKFKSVALTASYTRTLPSTESWIFPVVGVGLTSHFYKRTELLNSDTGKPVSLWSLPDTGTHSNSTYGISFGAETSLGLVVNVSENVFVMSQWRYRYVMCSGRRYGLEFNSLNVLDFSVDVGFQF